MEIADATSPIIPKTKQRVETGTFVARVAAEAQAMAISAKEDNMVVCNNRT